MKKKVYNYICDNCGFIFILPRPSKEKYQELYEKGQFSQKERKLSTPDDKKFEQCERIARTRIKILEKELIHFLWDQKKNKDFLEVGCGTGSFLRFMKACGWNVIGLEPDVAYTEAVKSRYNISIKNKFVEDFELDKKFDLISSFHVIEHIENPNIFLQNIYRLLNDDGYLFLECPSIDRWYGKTIDFFFWDVHINTFSEKTLLAFLAKNGFKVISWGWNLPVNGLWVLAKKDKTGNLSVIWDDPQRIRLIVEKASKKNELQVNNIKTELNPPQNKILGKIQTGMNLIINNPGEFANKVKKKIKSCLLLPLKDWKDQSFSNDIIKADSLNTKEDNSLQKTNHQWLDAQNVAIKPRTEQKSKFRIAHLGVHGNTGNGGDTLLFPAIRWLWQQNLAPTDFTLLQVRDQVTQKTIDDINEHDALIIGGGGLLLSDTNPNSLSGWQWACPTELLHKIKVPIIVFAIGYNRFRGQSEFTSVFEENIRTLVEKSVFFGLRNYGSIEALKNYLPKELHQKLIFQPCPTTLLSRFYPDMPLTTKNREKIISVNIAFDRHHLRFGNRENEILWGIAESLIEFQRKGWEIRLFNHYSEDNDAHLWFRAKKYHCTGNKFI